ncbi:FERM central domain protein, partial [Opisthorchis viverrini]
CWLDHDKPILRQISPGRDLLFRFGVKFYTPYPNLLDEECTRYLFALQVKRDLVTGTLLCSENTAALLASYVVQAEIGDFLEEEYHTIEYLRPLKLLHDPTDDRLQRVMEFHKAHIGLSPSEADLALLDTARKVEFYGLRLHFVRNHEGLGLNLAVSHLGILVFQNLIRINTFSWAKIRKLSFKRKRFLVKLQPERFVSDDFQTILSLSSTHVRNANIFGNTVSSTTPSFGVRKRSKRSRNRRNRDSAFPEADPPSGRWDFVSPSGVNVVDEKPLSVNRWRLHDCPIGGKYEVYLRAAYHS